MARLGGRNAPFAWVVGILCAAIVAGLAFLAIPMVPVVTDWAVQTLSGSKPSSERAGDDDGPVECRDLYVAPLWASLTWASGSELTRPAEVTATSAAALLEAAQPTVRFTCAWSSDAGTVSTTVAEVDQDAAAVAVAGMPALGFTCAEVGTRTRCARAEGEVVETVETGGGLLVASVETAWHPTQYAARVADRVWRR